MLLLRVASELKMSLEQAANMSFPELELWLAYFQICRMEEQAAHDRASRKVKTR